MRKKTKLTERERKCMEDENGRGSGREKKEEEETTSEENKMKERIETAERRASEREKMERIRECKAEKRMQREKLREEMEEGNIRGHLMERAHE